MFSMWIAHHCTACELCSIAGLHALVFVLAVTKVACCLSNAGMLPASPSLCPKSPPEPRIMVIHAPW